MAYLPKKVDRKTLYELEPALAHDLAGAIHFPNTGHCMDPEALGLRYVNRLLELGGTVVHDNVRNVASVSDGVYVEGEANSYHADEVVICAGYASRNLLKPHGLHIPIASERGYHYMLPTPGVQLHRPVVFGERYFVATPMHNGLRLAGTAEFSWPQAKPDMGRARVLCKETRSYVPGLCESGGQCWMGVRPSLPDAKPAIGRLKAQPNVLYACGHGHSGLTYSATTAHYIHGLLTDRKNECHYGDLSIERFQT